MLGAKCRTVWGHGGLCEDRATLGRSGGFQASRHPPFSLQGLHQNNAGPSYREEEGMWGKTDADRPGACPSLLTYACLCSWLAKKLPGWFVCLNPGQIF